MDGQGVMPAHPKLTGEARKQILTLVRAGVHPESACQAVGIARSTLRWWRMQANAGKKMQQAFMAELDTACAQGEARDVMMTQRAATLEKVDVHCNECGAEVQLDAFTLLSMSGHVTAAHNVKVQAAGIALQRLQLRFPKRWSARVVHTIEEEHNRLLDVAQAFLEPKDFERLLQAYLADDGEPSGSDEPDAVH